MSTRAGVLVALGVLLGVVLALGVVRWASTRSSSSSCAAWSYTGTVQALRQAAARDSRTCG